MKKIKRIPKVLGLSLALVLAGVLYTPGYAQSGTQNEKASFQIDGKWYGLPRAEVFQEEYSGPPVVGEFLTKLPNIAPLPEGNRTHEVRMDILAQEIEVADGVRYQAWTFGGSVPGPVLHVREGDRVIFTMKNRSTEAVDVSKPMKGGAPFLDQLAGTNGQKPRGVINPMLHSMDFHSGTVAADDKWQNVPPGMSIRFEWIANYPGVYLYHCGTPPILQHMSMGQYGMVVVSPKEGYPTDAEVDKEFTVVQSEFYLKEKAGQEGMYELDYDAANKKQPSIVAFNGHQSALVDHPLEVEVGDRIRVYLLNVGPNDVSSYHVVGAIFDRVWYEGNLENEWRGMQTVLMGASNGAVLEFIVPEEGVYVMVDHEMADAEKGAKGMFITKDASKDASH